MSWVDTLLKAYGTAAPLLSNAAGSEANGRRADDLLALRAAQFNLDAPRTKLTDAVHASNVLTSTPYKLDWGGPGTRGRTTGGPGPLNDAAKQVARNTQAASLDNTPVTPTPESTGDKLLSALALGSDFAGLIPKSGTAAPLGAAADGPSQGGYSRIPLGGGGPAPASPSSASPGGGSSTSHFSDPGQWDYILRSLLGMDPGSGGLSNYNDMWAPSALSGPHAKAR